MRFLIPLLLVCSIAWSDGEINLGREVLYVKNGDHLGHNALPKGEKIMNLTDVLFEGWSMAQDEPHTEVFVYCSKCILYQGNYTNVEIPADFIVIDALTIHVEEKEVSPGVWHKIIECGDNKTRTYSIQKEVDIVEEDMRDAGITEITPAIKKAVYDTYIAQGREVIETDADRLTLINTKETPVEKSYKHIKRLIP